MNSHFLIWEHGWQIAGWTMVYYLALGSLVALLAAALRWLLRSADPALRYATSLAVFATLALMPVGIAIWLSQTPTSELPLSQLAPAPAPPVVDLAITPPETDSPLAQLRAPAPLPPSEPSEHGNQTAWTTAHAIEYLPWVWLAGTPLTFVLLATGLIGAERLRRASQIVTAGPVHEAGERLRAALGVGRSVTVAICDRLATPLMVGIVRPLILLPPAALTGWSADELEMVLLHELAHIRRWDNLVNLLQRIVESLLFFHPAVWLVSRWVRLDREDCCDAVVVAHTAKPQAYAELLVSLATPTQPLAGLAMARHPLAGRIRRILHLEDETMLVSRNTLVGISTTLLAVVLAVSCYSPRETEADEATESLATENTESIEEDDLFASQEPEASRVVPDPGARATSPFPTLEEQRAADVAYKLLGLELEKLSEKELKRVKALGYSGGLRVATPGGGRFGRGRSGPLQNGDLLVGLHVWPTPSLDAVSEILSRDDLDQLSPLKFYVVRQQPAEKPPGEWYGGYGGERGYGGGGGYGGGEMVDKLVTGRISVSLVALHAVRQQQESVGQDVGPNRTNPHRVDEQKMLQQHLAELEHEIGQLEQEIPRLEHEFTHPENNHEQRLVEIELKKVHARREQLLQEREENVSQMEQLLREREERQPRQQGMLLYDGKTFDEWRKLWKTELKTENRTECIKALAAFGRAGKGKEAAEAILEIVKEYDWRFIGDGSLGTLQKTALGTMGDRHFSQGSIRAIPTDDWLPVLTKGVLAGNKRVIAFADYVYPAAWISAMRNSDEEARQRINQVFKDMGPDAVPYVKQHLLSIESMGRTIPNTDGKVQTQETKISTAAADLLHEITGSDEAAIEVLESVVGRKDTMYPRDLEQEKFLLERLKSRQER